MNDTDRAQWVDNDEGLYRLWKGSKISKREFVRQNRQLIDAVAEQVRTGRKPAHYLAYGG
jgi:hypothetical protein